MALRLHEEKVHNYQWHFALGNTSRIWQLENVPSKLPTLAVLSTQKSVDRTATVGSYEGTHHNCQRWQFYGHFSDRPRTTANLGSSMDTFRPHQHFQKYPSIQNCQRWQFYGHFSDCPVHAKLPTLAVLWTLFGPTYFCASKTANLGSCMDTFQPRDQSVHSTASVGSFVSTFNFVNLQQLVVKFWEVFIPCMTIFVNDKLDN